MTRYHAWHTEPGNPCACLLCEAKLTLENGYEACPERTSEPFCDACAGDFWNLKVHMLTGNCPAALSEEAKP